MVGGGFIGLEIAATARALGKQVTVLESAPRLLMRSVSPEIAEHVLQTHRRSGIDVRLGVAVGHFELEGGRVASLSVDGERRSRSTWSCSASARWPSTRWPARPGSSATTASSSTTRMRTSDPDDPRRRRLHELSRADEPAGGCGSNRCRTPTTRRAPRSPRWPARRSRYRALPWFWSEQGTLRLQMAGPAAARRRDAPPPRPGTVARPASRCCTTVGERLVCVESVNAPLDHLAARKLLEAGRSPPPAVACDPAVPLKAHA